MSFRDFASVATLWLWQCRHSVRFAQENKLRSDPFSAGFAALLSSVSAICSHRASIRRSAFQSLRSFSKLAQLPTLINRENYCVPQSLAVRRTVSEIVFAT
jgi:hypothetical protein